MAKTIEIDIVVNGKMQKATVSAKKLQKALDGVDDTTKKAGKSTGEYDRNLKGAAQATSNTTKEFAKMSQGMGGLVQVYATIAAQVFAVSAAFQFLKGAAEVSNLIKGQEAMGAATGVAYKSITASLKAATDGQLQYAEAAKAAAIGTAAGLSPDQLERLGVAAKNTSLALGRDLTDSFNRLIRGVTKAEPELLDELGIVLRLEEATREYADEIGKSREELNQFERSQAVVNNVLTQAETKFGAIQKIMDPSATSLNRFLASFDELANTIKTSIIDGLVPVFDFLSERTGALTAALTLFALPIVKTILPSFDAMAERADEALSIQEQKLGDLGKAYQKTTDDIRALGASKDEALGMTQKSGADTYKEIGIDPRKARTKGGFGAADFLTGGATSAKAQANAKKVLSNAEAQIKKHGKVLTGHLAGANAKQVEGLRRAYDRKSAILKKYEVQHGASWKKSELQIKQYATKGKMHILSLQKTVTRAGKMMGKALGAAFKLAGFLGIVALLFDVGKAVYEYFNPIAEEVKKANAATDEFNSTLGTLNEELDKMSQVRMAPELQSLEERVIALGNAFSNADMVAKFREFNNLDPNSENYDEAATNLKNYLQNLGKLSPAFQDLLNKESDLTKLSKESQQSLIQLGNTFIEESVAAQSLGQALKDVRTELQKLAGSGKLIDPTLNLRTALNKAKRAADLSLRGKTRDLEGIKTGTAAADLNNRNDAVTAKKEELKERRDFLKDKLGKTFDIDESTGRMTMLVGGAGRNEKPLADYNAKVAELTQLERDAQAAANDYNNQLEEKTAEYDAATKQATLLNAQVEVFNDLSGKLIASQDKINTAKEKQATMQTLGLNLEQQQSNVAASRQGLLAKEEQMKQRILIAEGMLLAAEKAGNAEELQIAKDRLEGLASEKKVSDAQLALERERLDIQEKMLPIQDKITANKNEQKILSGNTVELENAKRLLATQKKITDLAMRRDQAAASQASKDGAAFNPFFDQQEFDAKQNLAIVQKYEAQRKIAIQNEFAQKEKQITQEFELLRLKQEATALDFERLAMEAENADNYSLASRALLQAQAIRGVDYTDAEAAARALNAAEKTTAEANLKNVRLDAERAVEALKPMNQVLMSAGKAFTSSLNDAFNVIFDYAAGQVKDLNEALKEVGRGLLQTIQEAVTQQFIVNPILDMFGLRDDPAAAITAAHTSGAQAVGTAITTGASTMQTSIQTALNSAQVKVCCCNEGGVAMPGGSRVFDEVNKVNPKYLKNTDAIENPLGNLTMGPDLKLGDGTGGETLTIPSEAEGTGFFSSITGMFSNLFGEGGRITGMLGNLFGGDGILSGMFSGLFGDGGALSGLFSSLLGGLGSLFGGAGAGIMSLFGFKNGGIMDNGKKVQGYAAGGIAKGPKSGHMAMLHGKEAVVPLPKGNAIPVDMKGSGGVNTNNVSVNVDMGSGGGGAGRSTVTPGQGSDLGAAVAQAVQKELQNQKRAGGILNPYGTS